jgi:hypothetical protein
MIALLYTDFMGELEHEGSIQINAKFDCINTPELRASTKGKEGEYFEVAFFKLPTFEKQYKYRCTNALGELIYVQDLTMKEKK